MAFDIKKWLTDEMGLTGDDLALVETKLAPKASVLEAGYLRQGDYSTKMNTITDLQAKIDAKDAALAAEAVEWSRLTAAEKANATALRDSYNKKEAEALALRQRLETLAADAGLDPAVVLAEIKPAAPAAAAVAAASVDMSKFVTTEQYAGLVATAVRLPAMLMTLAREHKSITGEDLDTEALVTEMQNRAQTPRNQKSLDPRDIWNETHGIAAKVEAKRAADHTAEIKAAEDRGAANARTEMAIPGGSVSRGHHSVVFSRPGAGESILKRPQPGEGHRAAVGAFTSGKYRVQQKTA